MEAKLLLHGRNESDLNDAEKKLGKNCLAKKLDNSDINSFESFFNEISTEYETINCLVNNAGVSYHENSFLEVTEKNWDEQIAINLKGTYFMTQSYIKYFNQNKIKNAKIINMVSETAGQPTYRPYGITKSALLSFTRWLAKEYITKGIRVNAIAPGVTNTNMTNLYTKGKIEHSTAIGKRNFDPNEIAEICCFLLSDASNSISGQIIACNEANVCFDN